MASEPDISGTAAPSVQQILDSRAEALARPLQTEPTASDFMEVVTFQIGDEQFAIETAYVTEVIRGAMITPLPGDTSPVEGVTNLRGEILAVVSLRDVFSVKSSDTVGEMGRWVIVVGRERPVFGIDATHVNEVLSLPYGEVQDAARSARIAEIGLVRGVTEKIQMIIDGMALLQDSRFIVDHT